MIDVNVRNLKRDEQGFNALTKAQASVVSLCQHCAFQEGCSTFKCVESIKDVGAKILHCKEFHWPVVFRDTTGTESAFNTFRMGPAWFKRVEVGDRVGLIDKLDQVYGFARVKRKLLLSKHEAINDHAYKNHLLLTESQADAAAKMQKILRNNYGNLVYKNNDDISVIYLERDV